MVATRLVVVVLPCVPATAMPWPNRISSPSISARGITGIPAARAATASTLLPATAEDTTTTSAPATFPAACPTVTTAPQWRRRRTFSLSLRSDPLTR